MFFRSAEAEWPPAPQGPPTQATAASWPASKVTWPASERTSPGHQAASTKEGKVEYLEVKWNEIWIE